MTPALLVMDVQEVIVSSYADDAFVTRVARVVDAGRAAGLPVIYVVVGFRPGGPEISPRNKVFAPLAGAASVGLDLHPGLDRRDDDIVVVKRRVGAFAGSDLDVVLRAQSIDSLVITGITTSGVVLSTVRLGSDLDFALTVLSDCCADPDEEVQRVLMEKVLPFQATVVTSDEWASALPRG